MEDEGHTRMLKLRGRASSLQGLQLAALGIGSACVSGWVALSLTGIGGAAAGACTAPDPNSAPSGGVIKSINTTAGCDVADGNALYPVTGYIAVNGLTANTTYSLLDIYQQIPANTAQVYFGAYSVTLTPTVGSATDGAYTVLAGAATYPTLPATLPVGTLPTITTDGNGDAVVAYSLTVGASPGDSASSRNDVWVLDGDNAAVTHAATQSVKPPTVTQPTPTPTPESTPTPTPESTPTPTPESTPTPTPASTPTPTPASTPTPAPTGGVQGSSTTSTGGVGGIKTPNTGADPGSPAGTGLLISGLVFLSLGGLLGGLRRKSD
jgi:hypothetical protein